MSIKVKVNEKNGDIDDLQYPFLAKHEEDGDIILFVEESVGVTLNGLNGLYKAGQFADDWSMEGFKKFNGEITLSND